MASEAEEVFYVPLSALQHYAYCPRQCALIHIERVWSENYWTAQGRILHERVDSGVSETRGAMRTERGVDVVSHALRIIGKLDLLEMTTDEQAKKYKPVEYKRGQPKIEDWDKIQLCGQVLCLEEMLRVHIQEASLWYWEVRHRENICIDDELRHRTKEIIASIHALFEKGHTPRAIFHHKLCNSCSLLDVCGAGNLTKDFSKSFVEEIFSV